MAGNYLKFNPWQQKPEQQVPINWDHPSTRALQGLFLVGPEHGRTALLDSGRKFSKITNWVGGPTWNTTLKGRGLKFISASGQYVQIGTSLVSLADDNAFVTTMIGLIPTSAPAAASQSSWLVMGGDNAGADSGGPYLSLEMDQSSGNWQLGYRKRAGGASGLINGGAYTLNAFQTVTAVLGTNSQTLYVNGTQTASATTALDTGTSQWNSTALSSFYRFSNAGNQGDGTVIWFAGWNRALSAAEIRHIHNNPYRMLMPIRSRQSDAVIVTGSNPWSADWSADFGTGSGVTVVNTMFTSWLE